MAIDLEDSTTWDRDADGRIICPACGEHGRAISGDWDCIMHKPACDLPAWDDEDDEEDD